MTLEQTILFIYVPLLAISVGASVYYRIALYDLKKQLEIRERMSEFANTTNKQIEELFVKMHNGVISNFEALADYLQEQEIKHKGE